MNSKIEKIAAPKNIRPLNFRECTHRMFCFIHTHPLCYTFTADMLYLSIAKLPPMFLKGRGGGEGGEGVGGIGWMRPHLCTHSPRATKLGQPLSASARDFSCALVKTKQPDTRVSP